jgi:hypothetical protein
MRRLKRQIILLALCLAATLVAKHYVDKMLGTGEGSGEPTATTTAATVTVP